MAKRARRLLVYGIRTPEDLAKEVVTNYVTAAANVEDWSRKYVNNVRAYVADSRKQAEVTGRLAAWYNIFITEVYPRLPRLYVQAKSRYLKQITGGKVELTPAGAGGGPGV